MRLWVYAVRRVVVAVPVLIGAMTVLFVVFSALPAQASLPCFGGPGQRTVPCTPTVPCLQNPSQLCPNPLLTPGDNALGLNQPIYVQWFVYMGNAFTLQWGHVSWGSALGTGETESGLPSLAGQSVSRVVAEFLPYSVELLGLTLVFTLVMVVPMRARARAHPGGLADRTAQAWTMSGYSIPIFLVGTLALVGGVVALGGPNAPSPICGSTSTAFLDFFGSWPTPPCSSLYGTSNLGPIGFPSWLGTGYVSTPTGFPTLDAWLHGDLWLGIDTVLRMVLPALVLAFSAVAVVLRSVGVSRNDRTSVEVSGTVRTLAPTSPGVGSRPGLGLTVAEVAAGLRPALIMTVGMLPVVEILFNLWGVGRLFAYAVVGGPPAWDYGVMFGIMLTCTTLVVAASVVIDVVRAGLDPRFRDGANCPGVPLGPGALEGPRPIEGLASG